VIVLVGVGVLLRQRDGATASRGAPLLPLENRATATPASSNRLMATPRERLLGAILFGNNLTNIAASTLATGVLLEIFGRTGILYATVVMTVVIFVSPKCCAKTAAFNAPDPHGAGGG